MIPAKVRIFVCTEAVDMRYGFDRLAAVARERIGEDPQSGSALFALANRAKDRVKLLWFDRNGYCTLYKRFHRARPVLPEPGESGAAAVRIDAVTLGKLLAGIERRGSVSHSRAGRNRTAPRRTTRSSPWMCSDWYWARGSRRTDKTCAE